MKKIRKINVCTEMLLENHNINANEEGTNKEVNGRSAISGQKLKYMLLNTIKDLNNNENNIHISNGDGATGDVASDLRSDLGGFMNTADKSYSNRRTSPISVTYAVAKEKSNYFDDLFVRFTMNEELKSKEKSEKKHGEQRINNKTYSSEDVIPFAFCLDCKSLSSTEYFNYKDGKHLSSVRYKHVTEEERKRRASMYILSTSQLEGWANQSRNAISNIPKKVFIAFNTDNQFIDYFKLSESEQNSIKKMLDYKNVKYFIGVGYEEVYKAYESAINYLNECVLFGDDYEVKTQEEIKIQNETKTKD